jgi:hypothetical protein
MLSEVTDTLSILTAVLRHFFHFQSWLAETPDVLKNGESTMLQSKCYKSTFLTQVSMSLIYIFGIVCFHSDAIIRLLFRALWMYVFFNQLKKVPFKRLFAPFMSRVESDEWSRMNSHVFLLWWMMMTEHEVLKLSHWQTRPSFGMWMQGSRREDGFLFFCFSVFFLVAEVCACVWGGRDINQHVEELIKKKQDSWIDKNISYEKKRETNKEVSGLSMEHTLYREGDGDISIFSHSYLVYHLYLLEERLIWYSRYCLFLPHTHSHSIFQQLMKCIKRICIYSDCILLIMYTFTSEYDACRRKQKATWIAQDRMFKQASR